MSNAKFDFDGQVVLVTGANGNLGSAIAQAFADANARLVLVGRSPERVRQALPELVDDDTLWVAPGTDLMDPASTQAMVDAALERFGQIDVLANTVGGYRAGSPVHETPVDTWEFMMQLNARTAFVVSQAVAPHMINQSHGKIIHTASRAALKGNKNAAAYAAAKSAVARLTESLAAELEDHQINVNCVLPGTLDTPENRESMSGADASSWVQLGEIADVYLFLASDAAITLNGALVMAFGRS